MLNRLEKVQEAAATTSPDNLFGFIKTTLSQKAKIAILASSITAVGAAPVIYAVNQEEPQAIVAETKAEIIGDVAGEIPLEMASEESADEDDGFMMREEFFKSPEPDSSGSVSGDDEIGEGDDASENVRKVAYKKDPAEHRGSGRVVTKASDFFTDEALDSAANDKASSRIYNNDSGSNLHHAPNPNSDKLAVEFKAMNPLSNPTKKSHNSGENKSETRYINHDEENKSDDTVELLADKDYPSRIASQPHDLSRLITTDSFIPAVMYTAVNSEIPSKTVLAIVESDVSGFHGTNILIPKGSKLEGVYEKLENKHARRMQITWFKITRPDGVIIKLDAESADMQGAGGLSGYLDQRLKDRYGGALLLSSINALAQMSVKQNDIRQLAAVESFGREFGTLTAQIIRENINAMPVIMIRQGTRFNIRPYQNIYFPKPQNKTVQALFIEE
jgi:type IV secretory pathway VirB10-like protein